MLGWAGAGQSEGTVVLFFLPHTDTAKQTTFCRKAFSRAVDGNKKDASVMWDGVDKGFKAIVGESVESGWTYRISFGSVTPIQDVELADPAKGLAWRLMSACCVEVGWEKLPDGHRLLPQVLGRITGGNAKSLIVINIDETNVLMGRDKGGDYLRSILSSICIFNQQKDGFVFLI